MIDEEITPEVDKLAVLLGAQRIRFGSPIRFIPREEKPVFSRYIGVVQQLQGGFRFSEVLVEPGDAHKRTVKVRVPAAASILLVHAFRRESLRTEVIASLNNPTSQARDVELNIENDHHVRLTPHPNNKDITIIERISGGVENIVDNFNDTGRIDREPDGYIRRIVLATQSAWFKEGLPDD